MIHPRDSKQDGQTPEQKLAADVSAKVSQHLLDEAYSLLKSGVQADFADKNANEKSQAWSQIAGELAKDGSLTKLSAAFMRDVAPQIDKNSDGKMQKEELQGVANNARDPFYKGMAKESLKGFDTAASLGFDDKAIDKFELSFYAKRQFMPAREEFVSGLVKEITDKATANPLDAVSFMQTQLSNRGGMETLSERMQTWQQVADQLRDKNLVPKLSMAFLTQNAEYFDTNKNGRFSYEEVTRLAQSRSPIMKEFVQYVQTNFSDISTVDYNYDEISKKEQAIYEQKMSKQK